MILTPTPASAWLPLAAPAALPFPESPPHPRPSRSRSSSRHADLRMTFLPIPLNSLPTPRISVGILPVSRAFRTREEWAAAVKDAVSAGRKRTREEDGEVQVELRGMRRGDVEMVQRLQDASLPLSYPPIFYTHLLTSTYSSCILAVSPSSPSAPQLLKGCVSARLLPPSHDAHPAIYIQSLAIEDSARRSGLATRLVNKVIEGLWDDYKRTSAREGRETQDTRVWVSLHVLEENFAARKLYNRIGLEELELHSGFYARLGGKSAVEMGGWIAV